MWGRGGGGVQGCGERRMNHHHVLCSGRSWGPVKGYRAGEDAGVGHSPQDLGSGSGEAM